MSMKHLLFISLALLLFSCGGKDKNDSGPSAITTAEGDSTMYGLVCDGSNDSVVIILPEDLSEPRSFSIIEAFRQHRVYGFPMTGDHVAILPSEDGKSAKCLINIERLYGKWYRMVCPQWRKPVAMSDEHFERMKNRILTQLTDSARDSLLCPVEYLLELSANGRVVCRGFHRNASEDDIHQLVEYPRAKHYSAWHLYNGLLLLSTQGQHPRADTCTFRIVRNDTLIVSFPDGERKFYRKKQK